MADISHFVSRPAIVSTPPEGFYRFITDIRNFNRFIPADTIKNWRASENDCSFSVSGLGDLSLSLDEKFPHSLVSFKGDALKTINFLLTADIKSADNGKAEVILKMDAELNPIFKMMASGPIEKFLEMLAGEMENFSGWDQAN